ncbi:acetyltransferase [Vibrio cholerae]|uniref:Acetyltransferase n=1 Tax=Vibrio cholerae TaxID=666 RepID=A0A8B5ZF05_VIBCL|nr:acetyltransferase [Vibrio cholerae]MEB5529266.1 acetyltransferase [Vibrio cholerae]NAO21226.1 acetyltransferase [Vibrio cholerae]NAO59132.1 acetyltransferase [Vibrio cholerae]TXY66393.1 acetyltransferase [Vibrio cholerae]
MVTVGVFEFCGMRCQPLRRALCVFLENFHSSALIIQT